MVKVLIKNIFTMEYSVTSYCFLPLWHKNSAQYSFSHTSVYNLIKNYTIITDIVYIRLYYVLNSKHFPVIGPLSENRTGLKY